VQDFTIVCVLSNNTLMNLRWVRHHLSLFPPDFPVILVDNTTYFSRGQVLVDYLAAPRWGVIKDTLPLKPASIPQTTLSHGEALDFATHFITTPYIITIDNDCFLTSLQPIELLLHHIRQEKVGVAGWEWWNTIIYPYIVPILAAYRLEIARQFKFHPRWASPQQMSERYKPFYKPEYETQDLYAAVRKQGYLDVGQYLHYEAELAGWQVVRLDLAALQDTAFHVGNASSSHLTLPQDPYALKSLALPVAHVPPVPCRLYFTSSLPPDASWEP